jgi:hypothetical protein
MPQGYYTIEQWKPERGIKAGAWVAVEVLPFGLSQTEAERAVEKLGRGGFYRLVQTQRVIWAEKKAGRMRLRKSHASSPQSLEGMRKMFERCGGKFPEEEVRAARAQQKRARG